ncbi:MAG TPA: sulfotransferase, partial [Myxococcaceae bacterium]|nr:sulfotransferase [Myxococcaceae bacterium]
EVDPHIVAETVWALCNRNLLDFCDRIGPERCHRVRYEDLVADPAKVMQGLCTFLDLPFDERVLQPYDGKRERMIGGLGDPNILHHNRIDSGLGEAWKRIKWPRPLDAGTRAVAERLGYSLPEESTPAPGPDAVKMPASTEEAEKLLANLDQLPDDQVAELLAKLEAESGGEV